MSSAVGKRCFLLHDLEKNEVRLEYQMFGRNGCFPLFVLFSGEAASLNIQSPRGLIPPPAKASPSGISQAFTFEIAAEQCLILHG